MIKDLALIALGGAGGSVGRYLLALTVDARLGAPWGTWVVNVLGCLAIGLIAGASDALWVKHLVLVGLLGGFTTFSAFSLQSVQLVQSGEPGKALLYIAASLLVCLAATWVGLLLAPR